MLLLGLGFRDAELRTDLATLAVVAASTLTYYLCWRWSETSRARRMAKGGRAFSTSLPSPVPLLPRWLPFLGGHTLQMETEKMNQQVEGWADEFGGDFELAALGKRIVFVTGTEDIRRILLLRPAKFRRGWTPTQFSWMSRKLGLNPSLFFDEGKEWGRSRRIIAPSLSGHSVTSMIPPITKIAERVCVQLADREGEVEDFVEIFGHYTHDVIALAAFGFDADSVRATEDRPCVSFESMGTIAYAGMALLVDPLAMLGWSTLSSLLPWVRATKEGTSRLHRVVERAIDATRHRIEEGAGSDPSHGSAGAVLRKLVSIQGSKENTIKGLHNRMSLSDKEILTQAKGLFLAGSETTAKTLCWAMYFLAKHPETLSRCREEALKVAPRSNGMVSSGEQASQLVFCAAVFKETLRLWSAAPLLFFYSTENFTMTSGLELEAGTAVTVLLRYACLSEDAFTRAKDFVPERWIEAEREEALLGKPTGGNSSRVVHREEVARFFGGGPRVCPGKDMANLEAAIILAAITARFRLALAPSQTDPPEEVMTVTAGVRNLRLVLTKQTA